MLSEPARQELQRCQAERIASGKQAATSASGRQLGSVTIAPAQALLAPLQQAISSPVESLQVLYSLAVADRTERQSKERQDFNVQFGHALRTLREDIPEFFHRQQNMDIFTDDVVFVDSIGPRLGLGPGKVEGKTKYSRHLWALRLIASVAFTKCEVSSTSLPSIDHCS